MQQETLKNCPFCGGEARNAKTGIVECTACCARVSWDDEHQATVAWNTRNHTRAIEKIEREIKAEPRSTVCDAYEYCIAILKGE